MLGRPSPGSTGSLTGPTWKHEAHTRPTRTSSWPWTPCSVAMSRSCVACSPGDPSLVHRRSSFGHRSTLLHYVGSNGVETYRQRVPMNLAEITRLLVEAGADVNATANMYGGGSTTLGLLVTSDHPAKAGVTGDVRKVLEAAGAKRD